MSDTSPRVFTVNREQRGMRLDAFLSKAANLSRAKVKAAVQQGKCLLDGGLCPNPDIRLATDQTVVLALEPEHGELTPEYGDLDIVYCDPHLVVLNKPAGLTVHPCPSCPEGTLVHRLLGRFPELGSLDGCRPGIVHRLDKDTSGLMAVALTEPVRLALSAAFAGREVQKTYLALTRGVPASTGSVDLPVGRHPTVKTKMAVVPESKGGRPALTDWRTLCVPDNKRFALLAVTIHTGRTHQIRVHMAQLGHPLWGDKVYGPALSHRPDDVDGVPRQMLHAWKLAFRNPVTGEELSFVCPPPPDFAQTALNLSRRMRRVVLTGVPGCGKSTALHLLRERGLPAWSADAAVTELYEPGADGWKSLHHRFHGRFTPNGTVDRDALTVALMNEPGLREELEALIHPLVFASLEHFFEDAENAGHPLAVAEVPLWHESRMPPDPMVTVVTVACAEETRHARLAQRRGWSAEKIAAMDAWQWPQEKKIRASQYALDNSGDESALAARADSLLTRLDSLRVSDDNALRAKLDALWGVASASSNMRASLQCETAARLP